MSTDTRIFVSPARYVQGAGAIERLGEFVAKLGKNPVVIADDNVWSFTSEAVTKSFENAGLPVTRVRFGGITTRAEIERLGALVKDGGYDVTVGVGGGSTVDVNKCAGDDAGIPWVSVPTTASTDAPGTGVAVIYTPDGALDGFRLFPHSPDLVLVDTQLIANAPASFLIAGIGDALSTWLETRAAAASGAPSPVGGLVPQVTLAVAELSWNVVRENARAAIEAVNENRVTDELERLLEGTILLSGLGFESGGLSAAHSIHNGLTAAEQTHGLQHGQKVNFGSIVQLVLDDAPESEIIDFAEFTADIGLPTTLAELGIRTDDDQTLRKVSEAATVDWEFIHSLPFEVTADVVIEAMLEADRIGRVARSQLGIGEAPLYVAAH